jgi:hypothetical protein
MAIKMAKKQKLVDGVRFTFTDGTEFDYLLSRLSDDMVRQLAVHGLAQKVGDSYASAENLAEAKANAEATWENLVRGDFKARAQGSGGLAVEALARIKGLDMETAQEAWNDLDEESRDTLKKNPRVKVMIEMIRGEKAAEKLGTLGEGGLDFELPKANKKGKKES